jgi:hypothetical protein
MKTRINKSRVALAGMLSLATAALTLALSVAPAFAMGFSTWRTTRHGLSVPAPSAGGGTVSWAGFVVVAAVLAATVALGVIGWRRDRRGLERHRSPAGGTTAMPSASKRLSIRTPADVRSRRLNDRERRQQL